MNDVQEMKLAIVFLIWIRAMTCGKVLKVVKYYIYKLFRLKKFTEKISDLIISCVYDFSELIHTRIQIFEVVIGKLIHIRVCVCLCVT